MALRFLRDENQRGPLWRYIRHHNGRKPFPLDVVRLGDSDDLPLGSDDADILNWAQRENRILISIDRATLAKHLAAHWATGAHSPGIFLLRSVPLSDIVEFLVMAAYASEPEEWENQLTYIP
jgi:hypothetical protein